MGNPPIPRCYFQYSIRSLLFLTLAVALWLGYEVRQQRAVEETAAAISRLGGKVEHEPIGWSLLKYFMPEYGRRIVRAEISGSKADGAVKHLARAGDLREVMVNFDGTSEPNSVIARFRDALPAVEYTAQAAPMETFSQKIEGIDDRFRRFQARMRSILCNGPAFRGKNAPRDWRIWERQWSDAEDDDPYYLLTYLVSDYRLLRLDDGSIGELFALQRRGLTVPGVSEAIIVLIHEDNARSYARAEISTRCGALTLAAEDIDGDGVTDVGIQGEWSSQFGMPPEYQFAGDPRFWLELYRIDLNGFHSLLPRGQGRK